MYSNTVWFSETTPDGTIIRCQRPGNPLQEDQDENGEDESEETNSSGDVFGWDDSRGDEPGDEFDWEGDVCNY